MALDEFRDDLAATAAALATAGKGLLAADESTGTIGKRFAAIGLDNTEEHRRAYRSLLATAHGLGEQISGVILFEETLFQESVDADGRSGPSIVELFQQQDIIPGIKVDQGVEPLAGGLAGESWCTGLKGLGRARRPLLRARGPLRQVAGRAEDQLHGLPQRNWRCGRTPGGWPATPARCRSRGSCRSWSPRS
jgi:hypothetical protein